MHVLYLHRIIRHCNEECVASGVHFGKGVSALIAVTTIHYDPELWVDPQSFNPERWATFHKDLYTYPLEKIDTLAVQCNYSVHVHHIHFIVQSSFQFFSFKRFIKFLHNIYNYTTLLHHESLVYYNGLIVTNAEKKRRSISVRNSLIFWTFHR